MLMLWAVMPKALKKDAKESQMKWSNITSRIKTKRGTPTHLRYKIKKKLSVTFFPVHVPSRDIDLIPKPPPSRVSSPLDFEIGPSNLELDFGLIQIEPLGFLILTKTSCNLQFLGLKRDSADVFSKTRLRRHRGPVSTECTPVEAFPLGFGVTHPMFAVPTPHSPFFGALFHAATLFIGAPIDRLRGRRPGVVLGPQIGRFLQARNVSLEVSCL
uniref:Uncharacterized protein n=1 Tax=Steinernema glaseri TaxID=37863 RepID=A0A1I8ADM0_9BILA